MCAWSCSSRGRRHTCCRDLLLNKLIISPRRGLLFSPTPDHAPHCSTPCPRCPRKRRTPPRSSTVPPALPVQWVHTFCRTYSIFRKSMWGHNNWEWVIHLAQVRKLYRCCYWSLSSKKSKKISVLAVEAFDLSFLSERTLFLSPTTNLF